MPKGKTKTVTLYVRVTLKTHDELKAIAQQRGYPHTMNSVARESLERGMSEVRSMVTLSK